jgi:hypothetical protein
MVTVVAHRVETFAYVNSRPRRQVGASASGARTPYTKCRGFTSTSRHVCRMFSQLGAAVQPGGPQCTSWNATVNTVTIVAA